jgi:hypothetical protein
MRRFILMVLAMLPILSISFSAQAALNATSNNIELEQMGAGEGSGPSHS